jgi:hypothetical protein
MKKLLAALMMILSLSAVAGEMVIYDTTTYDIGRISGISPEYKVNPELGRAWVNLSFSPDYSDGPVIYDERVQVPGLRFDANKMAVVLDVAGEEILCAHVKKNFLGTRVIPTKNCGFKTKFYTVKRDNGYEVETVEKVKVIFNF